MIGAAGSACLAAAGGFALAGPHGDAERRRVARPAPRPGPGTGLAADRLSGMFLLMALGAAVPVSVALASWAARPRRRPRRLLAEGYALALGATAVIMTGRDAFTVLFGWEALTARSTCWPGPTAKPGRAGAARVTVAFGKLSGAALLIGLLLLVTKSHSILLTSFGHAPGGAATTAGFVLLIAGFAVKAGLVPFQVWMPRGYAAAPGPARAVMAGVCVNVAFYGHVAHSRPARPPARLAGRRAAGARRHLPRCSASHTPPCRTGCPG